MSSAHESYPTEIIDLLLKAGADPQVKHNGGESSIDQAEKDKNKLVLTKLQRKPLPKLLNQ